LEKVDYGKILFQSLIPTIVTGFITITITLITTFYLVDGKAYINNTMMLDEGDYVTSISIKNFKNSKILEDIKICIPKNVPIKKVQTNSNYTCDSNTNILSVTIDPDDTSTILIETSNKIESDSIKFSTNYNLDVVKTKLEWPYNTQYTIYLLFYILIYFIGFAVLNYIMEKRTNKVHNDISELREKSDKTHKDYEQYKNESRKIMIQNRLYYQVRIKDLSKELNFWKDTIRKIVYLSAKNKVDVETLFGTVTKELKTFGTNQNLDNDLDEIRYMVDKIDESSHSSK
jgi:hypothetical protein